MEKPKIISKIRIDGKVYSQDELSESMLSSIIEKVFTAAALRIGFEVKNGQKENTA